MSQFLWSVEIPGLTATRAAEIAVLVRPESPYGVVVTDPSRFIVRGLDRWTVELFVRCLKIAVQGGDLTHDEKIGAISMIEDYEDWLQQAGSAERHS